MSIYTTVTVADRTQRVVAENLATAVRRLREASATLAAQATQVNVDLDGGYNPRAVYSQTITDLVSAQGAFDSAMAVARHLLLKVDVQTIVQSTKHVFVEAADAL